MREPERPYAPYSPHEASYGRGIALTLASGASVVINYAHSADKAQKVVATIVAEGGKL